MTPYLKDTVERVVKTFVAVIGAMLASGVDLAHAVTDLSGVQKGAVAGLGAAVTPVFAIVGKWVGSTNNAGWTAPVADGGG